MTILASLSPQPRDRSPVEQAFQSVLRAVGLAAEPRQSDYALSSPELVPLRVDRSVSWHEFEYVHPTRPSPTSTVPDLTRGTIQGLVSNPGDPARGVWQKACHELATFLLPDAAITTATCTRRGGHTGRHAEGWGGRIIAVWQVP